MKNIIKTISTVSFNSPPEQTKNKKDKKNKDKVKNILTQMSERKLIEISALELLNLFVNYKIPVCKETIEAIQNISSFIIKK